jgi:hypothetical protein
MTSRHPDTAHWYYHPTAGYYRRADPQTPTETIGTRILATLVAVAYTVAMLGALLW